MNANQVLDRHYLEVRAKLLEIAATLDRVERAAEAESVDHQRLEQLMAGLQILQQAGVTDRAEQIQQLFSRAYDPQWRSEFEV
ncbi:hypothetical protein SH139x_004967 [Planctomycetaceae bacterium SH139]